MTTAKRSATVVEEAGGAARLAVRAAHPPRGSNARPAPSAPAPPAPGRCAQGAAGDHARAKRRCRHQSHARACSSASLSRTLSCTRLRSRLRRPVACSLATCRCGPPPPPPARPLRPVPPLAPPLARLALQAFYSVIHMLGLSGVAMVITILSVRRAERLHVARLVVRDLRAKQRLLDAQQTFMRFLAHEVRSVRVWGGREAVGQGRVARTPANPPPPAPLPQGAA